jgi:formylglycine-generating enzyme required for sulfatase activity
METKKKIKQSIQPNVIILAVSLMLVASSALANGIVVSNVTLVNTIKSSGTVDIQFDLSWSNSWRSSWVETNTGYGDVTVTNWDAAWVFIKWRKAGTNWNHAWLASGGHSAPAGITIDVGSNGGVTNPGAFIYRATNGFGNLALSHIRLRWNYAATNGPALTDQIDISVHAIEMVYIPQGSFYVGDGSINVVYGNFNDGINGTTPFLITNEAYTITLGGGSTGSLGNNNVTNATTMSPTDDFNYVISVTLPSAFPKGFAAFYCMKYEITQEEYTEFLNELTFAQATNRFPGNVGYRQTIGTNDAGIYTNGAPDRAANYLSWIDGAAYSDWAGLRPMTELEFEKTCRGIKFPVPDEYSWGATNILRLTNYTGAADGSGMETPLPAAANCACQLAATNTFPYPVRGGIFATSTSTRINAGAGYYGVMELSGNLRERIVCVGTPTGRVFTGIHGDGILTADGNANVPNWPTPLSPSVVAGSGIRGGSWSDQLVNLHTSMRYRADWAAGALRDNLSGFRAVRTAP